ncbi:fumarylacetoacetate hydrolase family protein [Halocynthiibacter sp. C4]|uniref:fumarylacetoacetate hydrolase family protein n=1 Tax=Halocynthiibacter sp. C4 TaxID=2992758 RepID=UPI00237B0257|nr:fumarylacetoacetate hydrolase family protein [Halocynthiibacter sp. C4]MDE0588341.1 fumarylacetoacetate hydrolase family protein [Halocynthiibacter sp. C4]
MKDLVIAAPEQVLLDVVGTQAKFPVRRVYCIGRNYAAHAVEMGHDPKEPPFFFQKNPNNLTQASEFPYPPHTNDVHHEAEIAVCLASGGEGIPEDDALNHVFGYALALDMTRRDLQGAAKKAGRPWEIGKAFEHSAPIGPFHPVAQTGHIASGPLKLTVNGALRQEGDVNQMIWKVPQMISYLSNYFALSAGDVILTGTPEGVGAVVPQDEMCISHPALGELKVTVVT